MGFHPLDILIVVGVALLLFGPKTLQSISHSAGRGMGQANQVKKKVLAELPMEDLAKVNETISQIPLSPQQAAQRIMKSTFMPDEKKTERDAVEEPAQEHKISE
jgi:Sec-independent protein translocase protein TatA